MAYYILDQTLCRDSEAALELSCSINMYDLISHSYIAMITGTKFEL